jgi:Uncharacterized conserved protein (DUF2249)
MADNEHDVRRLRKPDKHPTIFAAYAALTVGESFVLVNNHDPEHLRAEFDADHPGGPRRPVSSSPLAEIKVTPSPALESLGLALDRGD